MFIFPLKITAAQTFNAHEPSGVCIWLCSVPYVIIIQYVEHQGVERYLMCHMEHNVSVVVCVCESVGVFRGSLRCEQRGAYWSRELQL